MNGYKLADFSKCEKSKNGFINVASSFCLIVPFVCKVFNKFINEQNN